MKLKFTIYLAIASYTFVSVLAEAACTNGNCNSGIGTFKFKDGSMYMGEWQNGQINGHGQLDFPDGSKYVGQFQNGSFEGNGTLKKPNGTEINGLFHNNEIVTSGTEDNTNYSELPREEIYKMLYSDSVKYGVVNYLTTEAIAKIAYSWGNLQIHDRDRAISTAIEYLLDLKQYEYKQTQIKDQIAKERYAQQQARSKYQACAQCQQDCAVNKYQYDNSCARACASSKGILSYCLSQSILSWSW